MMEQPPPNDGMFPPGGPGPMDQGPPMMDDPSMGGPPPMDMGGPPMDNMGMNGMPPGPGMDGMDPMMDPMMQDPMMGGPDAMMNPPYFESSEYHKEASTVSTGHDGTTTGGGTGLGRGQRAVVSRQSSSASMELDSVSVKKIEDAEDEYGKVKQALLSDLEDLPASPAHTGAQLEGQPEFGLLSPNGLLPHPLLSTSSHLDLERISTDSRPPSQPAAQRRSKDTLESIFGGRSAAEPGSSSIENNVDPLLLPTTTTATKTESRSSYFSTSDNSSRSLLEAEKHAESHSFNLEEHPIQISSLSNNHSNHLSTNSSRIPNNKLLLVEEPFPVCLSPELEEMMGFRPASASMRGSTSAVVQPGMPLGSLAASGKEVYTIPEVPELEETSSPPSAAKGDPGRSRANKGTSPYTMRFFFLITCVFCCFIFSILQLPLPYI